MKHSKYIQQVIAAIACRICGAKPGQQCTTSWTHSERLQDASAAGIKVP